MPEKQFRDWNPDQSFLLPPSLQEWLPEDHPVYMMLDILEEIDVSAIDEKYQQKDPRERARMRRRYSVETVLRGSWRKRPTKTFHLAETHLELPTKKMLPAERTETLHRLYTPRDDFHQSLPA